MARYIDADIALEKMKNWHTKESLVACIKGTPTADVETVVRCKDCIHSHANSFSGSLLCQRIYYAQSKVPDNHFCGYGERRKT